MTVRITKNRIKTSVGQIQERFERLPKQAFAYWRKITPKRTGNARRKTSLKGKEIRAAYPYAQRLDEGLSKQAPDGMFEPTVKYIKRITKRKIRK